MSETFGERLKRLRMAAAMTQPALAERVGVSERTFTRYEHDEIEPQLGHIVKIAQALRVSLDYLMRGVGRQKGPALSHEEQERIRSELLRPDRSDYRTIARAINRSVTPVQQIAAMMVATGELPQPKVGRPLPHERRRHD